MTDNTGIQHAPDAEAEQRDATGREDTGHTATSDVKKGDKRTVQILRMAVGGDGIANIDGRIAFVAGGIPGDEVEVTITQVKKRFARATVSRVIQPSAFRVSSRCEAAAAGAGCCDFHEMSPADEAEIKSHTAQQEIEKLSGVENLAYMQTVALQPDRGWRTRVRLGVDKQGRAGFRAVRGNEIIPVQCSQVAPGLLDGIVGDNARTFTPGSEIIAALDSLGTRSVVEAKKTGRGRRVEHVEDIIEGDGYVTEIVADVEFRFPATAFWQAHIAAPEFYTRVIEQWLSEKWRPTKAVKKAIGWDLYGGVGLFVPPMHRAVAAHEIAAAEVYSVDYSEATVSAYAGETAMQSIPEELRSDFVAYRKHGRVEAIVGQLPTPDFVVIDPPRTGAGDEVIDAVAEAQPKLVVHFGCDVATFARDLKAWDAAGYTMVDGLVVDAFPGTHHTEIITAFMPAKLAAHIAGTA